MIYESGGYVHIIYAGPGRWRSGEVCDNMAFVTAKSWGLNGMGSVLAIPQKNLFRYVKEQNGNIKKSNTVRNYLLLIQIII